MSVSRCFSRAVHLARLAGCSPTSLPTEAERRARTMLAVRSGQAGLAELADAAPWRRAV